MKLLFLDFEAAYDSKQGYDLKKMSPVEYVRDPRFKAFGVGVAFDDEKPKWASAHLKDWLLTLDWSDIAVVAHNAKFDCFILKEIYGITAAQYIDTKALAKAVLGKTVKGFSLKELAEHFGFEPKGELKIDGKAELTEAEEASLADYCLHDVDLCRKIYRELAKGFPENQYPVMDWTIRTFVEPKLVLNHEKLAKASKEEAERRENIFKNLGIAKEVFASNPQFAELLKKNGYEAPTKISPRTRERIPALALGDPEFNALLDTKDAKLKGLLTARVAAKSTLLETRTATLAAIGRSGAWPFDVEFSGAMQTHRFSGSDGAGGNPQNFIRGSVLREAVEAPQGCKQIVGDFCQIEARLAAYISGDPGLIKVIQTQPDLYCDYGSAYFGRRITKADDPERRFSKEAVLGLNYNMGAETFQERIKIKLGQIISIAEAKRAVSLYRGRYFRIPEFWRRLDRLIPLIAGPEHKPYDLPLIVGNYAITLPDGLKMQYPGLRQIGINRFGKPQWGFDAWDKKKSGKIQIDIYGGKLLENICQGLAGVLCRDVLKQFREECVGQCHDELLLIEKAGLAHMTAARLKQAMETPPAWMPEMKLAAEVHIGSNWRDAK